MATKTQEYVSKESGVVLDAKTTVEHAVSMHGRGVVTKESLVFWACNTPLQIADLFPLCAVLSGDEFKAIGKAQDSLRAAQATGSFSIKLSDRGAVQFRGLPGVSAQFGLTLYAAALETLFSRRDQIEQFIASDPVKTLSIKELLKPGKDGQPAAERLKYVAEVREGKIPGATIGADGDTITVRLSRK